MTPKVQTYPISDATPTAKSGRAAQDPKRMAALGGEVKDLGEGLASIGEHFQKLRNEQEITSAKVALSKATDAIHINSLKDPDVWGQPEKIESLYQEAAEAAATHIKSNDARIKFQDESQLIIDRKRTSLMMGIMNRQSNLYKGTYVDRIGQLATEYETALPQDQKVIRQEMERERQNAISVGGVNPSYADTHLRAVMESLGTRTLKSDLGSADAAQDPVKQIDAIQSELSKGDDGKYSDIPKEKRDAAFKEVQSAKTRAEKTAPERVKIVKHLYDKTLTKKYADGSLTEQDLIHAQNRMSEERFKLLSKNIMNGNMATQTNPEEYSRLVGVVSDQKNTEEQVVNEIIKSENEGKLTTAESKDLVKMFQIDPNDDPIFKLPQRPNLSQMLQAQEEHRALKEKKVGRFQQMVKAFQDHFGHNKKGAVDATKEVVKKYNAEDPKTTADENWLPSEADKKIMQDNLRQNPDWSKLPKDGVRAKDKFGPVQVYPDGHTVRLDK